jgi:NtrC-family two-component system response regulator AlgB
MRILIVDDEPSIRKAVSIALKSMGHQAREASDSASALKLMQKENFQLAFLDLNLGAENGLDVIKILHGNDPYLKVVVFTAFASIETAVEAIHQGAVDYIAKPFTPNQIEKLIEKMAAARRLEDKVAELEQSQSPLKRISKFETKSPAMQKLLDEGLKVGATNTSILLLGENGTGKTTLARYFHAHSPRKEQAFVTVNCPSLSKELLESELFGHIKGSFTGALDSRWGKVAAADGGTLFLDEIGEIPLEIQSKLLRLLQDKEYERIGEVESRQADIRIIAATNKDLKKAVSQGHFREDLYYRLSAFSLIVPPLRERLVDLDALVHAYLQSSNHKFNKNVESISPHALDRLRKHSWKGNLRELKNMIERAVILSDSVILEESLLFDGVARKEEGEEISIGSFVPLKEIEKHHVQRVIANTPTLEEASSVLGIDTATLYRKRKKWDEGGE